jgi:hypothetical protein
LKVVNDTFALLYVVNNKYFALVCNEHPDAISLKRSWGFVWSFKFNIIVSPLFCDKNSVRPTSFGTIINLSYDMVTGMLRIITDGVFD